MQAEIMGGNSYYSICLDLENRPCLVVGGGDVAARKVEGLLRARASVTLLSPQVSPNTKYLIDNEFVKWNDSVYQKKFIYGMTLVIAATDNLKVNKSVYEDCVKTGIPVNVVDEPSRCTFIIPAILQRGDIQIAVNTGGAAPLISGKIRDHISLSLDDGWESITALLKELRPRIKNLPPQQKEKFWNIIRGFTLDDIRKSKEELKQNLEQIITAHQKD
ncbi:Siroheme synthase [Chitinispirillum alkaliphilum]|nr:Siroheme synthase [Chitinispirillum alkaliphilum]